MKKSHSSQMPAPCAQWAEKLAATHTNDLSHEERVALDQHVVSCPNCAAVLVEYQQMDLLISHLPAVTPLAALPPNLQQSIDEQENAEQQSNRYWENNPFSFPPQHRSLPSHPTSRMKQVTRVASSLAAVLIVGVILGSFLLLLQKHNSSMGSPKNWNCPVPSLIIPHYGSDVQTKPVLSQSILYTISNLSSIKAIHLNDGSPFHTYQIANTGLFNMAVADGVIYADIFPHPGSVSFIYAIRASDGAILWHHLIPQLDASGPPIIENGVLYVDSQDQHIYALHTTNGDLIGQYKKTGKYDYLLAVNNGLMFVQSNYALYVVQPPNGRILWQFDANDLNHSPNVTIAEGRVYISAMNNNIYILQASDGHFVRKIVQSLSSDFEPIDAPFVAGGIIYTKAIGGYIYALQAADGSPLWCNKVKESSEFLDSFTVTNGMMYVNTSSGQLNAFNASNGKLRWQFQTENSSFALPPLAQNGTVYAVTLNNTVYALRGSDGKLLWKRFA